MTDIDHFKHVNDTYGHQAGDVTIKHFADIINSEVREYDVVCRYGGEEFLIFLPEAKGDEAKKIADRTRTKLSNSPIVYEKQEFSITSSFGIVCGIPEARLEDVIKSADIALYQAKKCGRNRTEVFVQSSEKMQLNDATTHS